MKLDAFTRNVNHTKRPPRNNSTRIPTLIQRSFKHLIAAKTTIRFHDVQLTYLSLAPWLLLPLFPFMCCVMNHTCYRDGHVIALCLRDLVILSLGQRGHC